MALAAERSFVMAVKEAKDIIAGLGRSVDLVYLVCQLGCDCETPPGGCWLVTTRMIFMICFIYPQVN